MWLLTNTITGNVLIVISEKSKYTVGRVGADLVITDDSSISRTHAFIHFTTTQIKDAESSDPIKIKELLELEDAGSKYGTFHNDGIAKGVVIPKQKRLTLAEGDRIRFGVLKNIWTVSNITPFISISVLPKELAMQLKQCVQVLGGCILADWDDTCTHLTLAEIYLCSKLLHAILDSKPIVTCDYWYNVVQAARRGRRSLPKVESYMPPNAENFDLKYREERKLLFNNLTFVFLHAHHFKKYAPIVEKAGGRSKHLNVGIQKSFLVRNDVVVVQYVPSTESQSSQTINTIEDFLKLHSRRTVPEFEIGLALIQCSTKRYCNPSFNANENFDLASKSIESNAPQCSVQDFPNISNPLDMDETEVFIPETDRKSSCSTDLTSKSPAGSTGTCLEQTGSVDIESQTFEPEENGSNNVPMSSLQVTESVQDANKRKRTRGTKVSGDEVVNSQLGSEDDELFNFAAKKVHLEEKRDSPIERETRLRTKSTHTSTSSTVSANRTPKSCDNQLPVAIHKGMSRKAVINMSGFLEKSQVPNLDVHNAGQAEKNAAIGPETSKQGAKRARIADIDNSDDDDLFCFGGKSNSNDDKNNAKRVRTLNDGGCDSDEDLFNFGGVVDEQNYSKDVVDADIRNQPPVIKNKPNQIIMPKPKQLPAKISVADWLDCSLSALSIKAEQFKDEVDIQKKEMNDPGVAGDSKDVIEPIEGGCVVKLLDPKSLLHKRDLNSKSFANNENDKNNCNKSIKNFKKFTKKFHSQNLRVIRTVSSTVCGSLV
ncbi:nibrin [Anastrepha obliqua]|uniref:nibrin n=1 Tax=Anastrepha obliqua TaxID=95512 RepID=UPI002409BAD6|nr:nibrin [Anastrepha obliqua]